MVEMTTDFFGGQRRAAAFVEAGKRVTPMRIPAPSSRRHQKLIEALVVGADVDDRVGVDAGFLGVVIGRVPNASRPAPCCTSY